MQHVDLAASVVATTGMLCVVAATSAASADFGQQRRFTEQQYARLMQQVGLATELLNATVGAADLQHGRFTLQQ